LLLLAAALLAGLLLATALLAGLLLLATALLTAVLARVMTHRSSLISGSPPMGKTLPVSAHKINGFGISNGQ
jgi:hypothetical protein